jgi:Pyruvate kinase, barrel domain
MLESVSDIFTSRRKCEPKKSFCDGDIHFIPFAYTGEILINAKSLYPSQLPPSPTTTSLILVTIISMNVISGPELRGGNITLETVLAKTDVSRRQTKIICTLGPACWDVATLEQLIDAGLSVARFNFSHGDHEGHQACLDRLHTAARNKNKHIGASFQCLAAAHQW